MLENGRYTNLGFSAVNEEYIYFLSKMARFSRPLEGSGRGLRQTVKRSFCC